MATSVYCDKYFSLDPEIDKHFLDDVKEDIEQYLRPARDSCRRCGKTTDVPRASCTGGHTLCQKCRPNRKMCSVCYLGHQGTVEDLGYDYCPNDIEGCFFKSSYIFMEEHKLICPYGYLPCPLDYLKIMNCLFRGRLSSLKDHTRIDHPAFLRDGTVFRSCAVGESSEIVFAHGESFIFRKRIHADTWTLAVFLIGPRVKALEYCSKFTLDSYSDSFTLESTFPCHGYADHDLVYKGEGFSVFRVGKEIMDKFIFHTKLNITVEIKRVGTNAI